MNCKLLPAAVLLLLVACTGGGQQADFPAVDQDGRTAVVAHRGFWNCEEGGFSQNSIASLAAAQQAGFWGSEFDVHLTADDIVVVHHDPEHDGIQIQKNPYSALSECRLPNGETIPTLDEYLTQGEQCPVTMLVLELKKQQNAEREDRLLACCVDLLKGHGLFYPDRVVFISFSRHICERIAELYPAFTNQFLSGNLSPEALARKGINGFDYERRILRLHSGWIRRAHALGQSTNAWTVNKAEDMQFLIDCGIDAITTNDPLLARELLGEREFRPEPAQ